MTDRPLVIAGFVGAALPYLAVFGTAASVILIEEPDIVRERHVRSAVAGSPQVRDLIEWEHQRDGAADAFVRAHPDLHPGAVGPLTEYATQFAAGLAERYGLPGASVAAADVLRDKAALRRVTREAGIVNPASEAADGPRSVREFMASHPGPVVLKPANRQATVGTKIVRSPAEVDQAWEECIVQDEGPRVPDRPIPLRMLVEQYVSGQEYSVEMLLQRGSPLFSNVTAKTLVPGPRPVELAHVVPADLPSALDAQLRRQTELVLRAVGFGTGIAHCEWIVSGGIPHLVECAGRFAGDEIVGLIERAYPIDLFGSYWSLMKGEQLPPLPRAPEAAAAVRFLVVEPGLVRSVAGLDEARAVPGVLRCEVDVEPGDTVPELRSSWDRVGHAIACAPTAAEAAHRAEQAIDRVRVEVAPAAQAVV